MKNVILHVLQGMLLVGIYWLADLYANRLGFMRNVSHFSHKLEAYDHLLLGACFFLFVIAILAFWFKRSKETILLVVIGVSLVVWQLVFSLSSTPIYYLIGGVILLIYLLQLLVANLQGGKK